MPRAPSTSFNKPATITQGTTSVAFTHDVDHQRYKQVATVAGNTTTTLYLAAFGIMVEKVTGSGGLVRWNEYIFGAEGLVAERFNTVSGTPSVTTRYLHLDNLGSVATLSDENGVVVERDSYDAWGKRRFPNGTDDTANSLASQSTRGFTGHEELDDVTLVHMNGRVYDPYLGRFTSADPTVQQPFNSQGWNRYAYVQNNPLAFTDPNGYGFLSFLSHIFNPIQIFQDHLAIARAINSVPILRTVINAATIAVATYFCGPCSIGVQAALASLQAGITSGKLGVAFEAGLIAGGEALPYVGPIVSGVVSAEQGGGFLKGYLASEFSSLAGGVLGGGGGSSPAEIAFGIIKGAAISGTASVIAGGKFETGAINGAATVAFAYAVGLINNGAPNLTGGTGTGGGASADSASDSGSLQGS